MLQPHGRGMPDQTPIRCMGEPMTISSYEFQWEYSSLVLRAALPFMSPLPSTRVWRFRDHRSRSYHRLGSFSCTDLDIATEASNIHLCPSELGGAPFEACSIKGEELATGLDS